MDKKSVRDWWFEKRVNHWDSIYSYNDFWGHLMRTRQDHLLAFISNLPVTPKTLFLDVGCGTGIITSSLLKMGYRVVGCDYSLEMLKALKVRSQTTSKDGRWLQADIEHLPIKPSCSDFVICLGVLIYLDELEKSLEEIARVLLPNGIAIVTIFTRYNLHLLADPYSYFRWIKKNFKRWWTSSKGSEYEDEPHGRDDLIAPVKHYTIRAFNKQLRRVNMKEIYATTYGFGPLNLWNRRIFSDLHSIKLSQILQKLRWLPFFKNLGVEYMVAIRKPR